MYSYDYRISLGVQHPVVSSADISARLGLERGFFRDVGTDLRGADGRLIRVHAYTWVLFELAEGKDGWLMDAWPEVVGTLQARAAVIEELTKEGAEIGLRIGLFGKQAWAGFVLDDALVRLMADLRLGFHVETYFPDPPADPGTDDDA
ncbi:MULTISPECIES: hypothetical protein [unclassified Stenotrophomonas]|uniref:hypothetical protein n=1 Tax=unclassified Stenotrophomonas TaxID=196198 RepID=UPI000DE73E73|nr:MULTISPECIES: hypothetical protein [unclassified Stenotrophomonas]PWB27111.1 hypothetical protein DCO49_07720 [Stenotrophomonas sp. SPM]